MEIAQHILIIILCYLIGSIPVGLIISKTFKNKDLRLLGSKNIGSSNATRILGFKYGLIVFVLDFFKGFWLFFMKNNNEYLFYYGTAVIVGHMFSIFNKFKGGKAIATSVGFITIINLYIGLSGILSFIIIIRIWGYASVASIISTLLVNILLWVRYIFYSPNKEDVVLVDKKRLSLILIITIIIFIKHLNNIKNLIKKQENKFNFVKKK